MMAYDTFDQKMPQELNRERGIDRDDKPVDEGLFNGSQNAGVSLVGYVRCSGETLTDRLKPLRTIGKS